MNVTLDDLRRIAEVEFNDFPNTAWRNVETYPRHFHNGSQTNVEAAPFSADILESFRDFLRFVKDKKTPPPDEPKTRADFMEL